MAEKYDFLVDVDGVLANFDKRYRQTMASLGIPEPPDFTKNWDSTQASFTEDHKRLLSNAVKEPGWCACLDVCDGAKEGIDALRALDCEIVVVTAPWKTSRHWMWERKEWLQEHFDIDANHVIFASKKHRIAGDFFLDDNPDHCAAWAAQTHSPAPPLLWDTEFNRSVSTPFRVHQWDRVVTTVETMKPLIDIGRGIRGMRSNTWVSP